MRAKHRQPQLDYFNQRMTALKEDRAAMDELLGAEGPEREGNIAVARGVMGWEVLGLNEDGHAALLACSGNFGQVHLDFLHRVSKAYLDAGVSYWSGGGLASGACSDPIRAQPTADSGPIFPPLPHACRGQRLASRSSCRLRMIPAGG